VNKQPVSRSLFVDSLLVIEGVVVAQTDATEPRVGATIRRLRHAAGHSQESLAQIVGLELSQISILEEDDDGTSIETLCLVATALGTTASHIFAAAGF
jgi:DNA-binding XRE family transcriptional regulator